MLELRALSAAAHTPALAADLGRRAGVKKVPVIRSSDIEACLLRPATADAQLWHLMRAAQLSTRAVVISLHVSAGLVPWLAGAAAAAGAAAVSSPAQGPGGRESPHAAAAVRAMDALGSLLRVRVWQAPGSGLGLGRTAAGGALADFAAAARRILLCLAGGSAQQFCIGSRFGFNLFQKLPKTKCKPVSGGLCFGAGARGLFSVCVS